MFIEYPTDMVGLFFFSHLHSGWMSSSCKDCRAEHSAAGYYIGCKCRGFNGKWSQVNENDISVEGGWLNLSMFQYLLSPISYLVFLLGASC